MIVGSDLGFVFWLGQILDSAGHQALPAKSVSDASAILSRWGGSLDILVISSKLPDARSFVTNLRSINAGLRVIAIVERDSESFPGADALCVNRRGQEARAQWLDTIGDVLEHVPTPQSSSPVSYSEPNQKVVSPIYPQKSHRHLQ